MEGGVTHCAGSKRINHNEFQKVNSAIDPVYRAPNNIVYGFKNAVQLRFHTEMVGYMSRDGKSIYSKIENERLYAVQEAERAERRMQEIQEEARDYSGQIFRDPDAVSALFYLSAEQLEPEHKLIEHIGRLIDRPREFGRLKGISFLPKDTEAMQPHLEKLRDCLKEHIDQAEVRKTYRDHHQEAIDANRLPASRQEEALQQLQRNREYCDSVRNARDQRAVERRRQWA